MLGCTNVIIEGLSANDSGGDGFYIGSSATQKYCKNVKLIDVTADNNKRQGLSLISGINVDVLNSAFINTKDDLPGAGIDIEPNDPDEILQNINIINTRTENNEGGGILIATGALSGSLLPVSIYVSGHYDFKSRYGFIVSYGTGVLNGSIIVDNSVWEENLFHSCLVQNYSVDFPKVTFKDCKSINANASGSTATTYGCAMIVFREAGISGPPMMGNVEFINPEVIETRTVKKVVIGIKFQDLNLTANPTGGVKKCFVKNPKFVGISDFNRIHPRGEVTIIDETNSLDYGVGNLTRSFDWFSYAPFYHNGNSTTQVLVTLGNLSAFSPEVTFEARTTNQFIIRPSVSNNILPLSSINGKGLYTTTIGSRLTLQKKTANSWFIKEIIGTWVVES